MLSNITSEKKSIISPNTILKLHYLFVGDLHVFMCRNLILNKVFENGIQVCMGKTCKEVKMSEAALSEIWIPFSKDIVDAIMTLGIAPIRFKKIQNDLIPYVPKWGSFSIHVKTTKDGLCEYTLHDMDNPEKPAPNSIVLSGFGYDPRSDGSICSIIKVLEPSMQFVHQLSDCALTAEKLRCNPPIIVEKKETTHEAKEGLDFDFFMDSDALKSSLNSQYQRDEKEVNRLKNQQRLFAAAINGTPQQAVNSKNTMNNIIPLPSSFNVGSVIEPSGRNDYSQILRSVAENICSVMGVPRSMMISDNVVRGDVEGSHDVFKQSCLLWKNIASKILTWVYRHTHSKEEAQRLSKIAKKRKIADITKVAEDQMIKVIVPVTPYISNEELKQLYLQQLISWDTYKQYVLRNCSLPIELMKQNPKDPWSKEDKLLMLGVTIPKNENQAPTTTKKTESKNKKTTLKSDKTSNKTKAAGVGNK